MFWEEKIMRIGIVDDEATQQRLIEKYIREWGKGKGIPLDILCFDNSESFLFYWEEDKCYDLLVLDIEMGQISGLELAKKLRQEDEELPIMFVTGYDEYMSCGYDVAAMHYLIKPLDKTKFFKVLDRLSKERKPEEKLFLDTTEGNLCLSADRIWYVEAAAHQSVIYTEDGEYTMRECLGIFETMVEGQTDFVKCHRSYVVNLRHVASVLKTDVMLDDGRKIPLSRNAAKRVNERFIKYYRDKM